MFKRRAKKTSIVSLLAFILGWLIWEFSPIQPVFAIANLSDPAKLATLAPRGANPRLNKIVYWLDRSRRARMAPETTLALAQTWNRTREPRASLVKESLFRNLKIADELGLLTDDNLEKLRHGNAAIVTRGIYAGTLVEIDHIVPISLAPEIGNELANLEMLPEPLNLQKSSKVGPRQLAYAQKLHNAGLLQKKSLQRIMEQAR